MAKDEFEQSMSKMRFDTENMLNLVATANIVLDAQQLYDSSFLEEHAAEAEKCHIYMIGHTPTVTFEKAYQDGEMGLFIFNVSGVSYQLPIELPPGATLEHDQDTYILMPDGKKAWPDQQRIGMQLSAQCGYQATPPPNRPFPTKGYAKSAFRTNFGPISIFVFYNIFIKSNILGWIRSGYDITNAFVNCRFRRLLFTF